MKKLSILLPVLAILYSCNSPVNVTGTVTYYFNDNYGQKPDLGAEVYFMPSEGKDLFYVASKWTYSKVSPNHKKNTIKIMDIQLKAASLGQNNSKEIIDSMAVIEIREMQDRQDAINLFKNMMGDNGYKAVTNADGQFNVALPPGQYYTMVIYSHREGIEMSMSPQEVRAGTTFKYSFEKIDLE